MTFICVLLNWRVQRLNKSMTLYTVFHEYLAGIIFSEFVILEISRVFNLAIPKKKKKKKKKKRLFCCSLAYTPAYTHPAIAKYSAMYIVFKIQYYTVYFVACNVIQALVLVFSG